MITLTGVQADGTVAAAVNATAADVVGFALYQPVHASGDPVFHPIGLDTSPGDGFSVVYNPTKAQDLVPLSDGEVDIVAAPCLAADIPAPFDAPAEGLAVLQFTYNQNRLRPTRGTPAAVAQAKRLVRTACTFVPPPPKSG